MKIDVKNIKAAYRTATESEKKMLSTLFPDLHLGEEEKGNRPVTERIKTFEDACAELGDSNPMVLAYRDTNDNMPDITAYMKLRIITAALNEGWEPQFTRAEWRWYPWFYLWTDEELSNKSDEWRQEHALKDFGNYRGEWAGLAYTDSVSAPSDSNAYVGSRLYYKSKELAEYSGKQFIDLWADFYLIRK